MSVPSRLGPYAVSHVLGQGGMGVVYAVQDPLAPRALALKMVRAHDVDEVALERFWREAEVLARVRHRSVVRVHKVGRLPEGPFVLTDLVEGEPLSAVRSRGPLAPREAARIARELAGALEAVHAAGVLHRDVKPGNVVLRADGIPVLLDFGLARDGAAKRLTLTGQMVGTPAYMAPEQAGGDSTTGLGPTVDVYGLGALLYELLTARPPFEGESPLQTMRAVLTRDPVWPSALCADVPPALDAIVRRAMARAPSRRYPTAAALRDDLDRFLAGRRAEAEAERRGAPRRLALLLGAGTALVAALVAAVGLPTAAPPPAAVDDAAPRPDRRQLAPAPPARAGAWTLAPGDALAYASQMQEDDGRTHVEVRGDLAWSVEALEDDVARVRVTFVELDARCGPSGGELGGLRASTRTPGEEGDPLAGLLGLIRGAAFELSLVTTTGEVRQVAGTASVVASLQRAGRASASGAEAFRPHEYLRCVVDEAPLRAALDALCRVEGAVGRLERRVTTRDGAQRSVVVRGPAAGFVLDTLISPFGDGRVEARGESRFEAGRLSTSWLEQVLVEPGRGDVTQRSTIRAALEVR